MKHINDIKKPLDSIKKENPYKVPENYFDDFPVKMAHRISKKEPKNIFFPIWANVKPRLIPAYIITGLAVLVVLSVVYFQHNSKHNLSATEFIELYQYSALNETSESDLIKELSKISDVSDFQKDTTFKPADNFANEAIDYLKNENVDVNSLIDAL